MRARNTVTGTIPAACFEVCNNANLEAQSKGKVPELCVPDSEFRGYYEGCLNCIDRSTDAAEASGRQYIDESLSVYLNYCESSPPTTTQSTATIPTSWLTWYETYEPTTLFDLRTSGGPVSQTTVLYKGVNITSTIPAYFFHVSAQSLISSYIPPAVFSELAASAASAASMASVIGDATSLIYAALEDESRPPWFSSAVPSTYAVEMSNLEASINELRATPVPTAGDSADTSALGATSTSSGSRAWIAGAVVGSIAGAVLILLGVILFLRRKKLAAQIDQQPDDQAHDIYMTGFKTELHSESVQPPPRVYEMDASQNLSEMAVHEKPQELSAEEANKTNESYSRWCANPVLRHRCPTDWASGAQEIMHQHHPRPLEAQVILTPPVSR